jgi:hypothetical protein
MDRCTLRYLEIVTTPRLHPGEDQQAIAFGVLILQINGGDIHEAGRRNQRQSQGQDD